jgi:P27 family predicted phage terminase small subunit
MRGGHNIKPTAQKKTEGTSRADRDARRLENVVPILTKIPPPPAHFEGQHKKKWKEVCKKLMDAGTLADADSDAISAYIDNWFVAEKAMQDIQEKGSTIIIETEIGTRIIANPSFRIYQDSIKMVKAYQEQFGFTPKARQSIKSATPQKQKESAVMKLLKGASKNGTHD